MPLMSEAVVDVLIPAALLSVKVAVPPLTLTL